MNDGASAPEIRPDRHISFTKNASSILIAVCHYRREGDFPCAFSHRLAYSRALHVPPFQ
jgi:hypothetical protein